MFSQFCMLKPGSGKMALSRHAYQPRLAGSATGTPANPAGARRHALGGSLRKITVLRKTTN